MQELCKSIKKGNTDFMQKLATIKNMLFWSTYKKGEMCENVTKMCI